MRAIAVVRRKDAAIVVEVQVVRVVAARRSRPTAAEAADIVETAIDAAAITRSRIPDGGGIAETAREVYAFFTAVISVIIRGR